MEALTREKLSSSQMVPIALLALTAGLIILLSYLPVFSTPLLLDEQFNGLWVESTLKNKCDTNIWYWLAFKGYGEADGLAPVGALISAFSLHGTGHVFTRMVGLILHALNVLALYLVAAELMRAQALRGTHIVATLAALLFSVFPMTAEAVFYSGGRGIQLASLLFLSSFFLYLLSHPLRRSSGQEEISIRQGKKSTTWLAVLFFAGCVFTLDIAWLFAKLFIAFELSCYLLSRKARTDYRNLFAQKTISKFFIARLATIVIIALAAGYFAEKTGGNALPFGGASAEEIKRSALTVLFPINRAIFSKYAGPMHQLFVLYPFIGIGLLMALWRSRLRAEIVFCFLWLGATLVIFASAAVPTSELYGARFLYFAAAPFCLLIAIGASGFLLAFRRFPAVTATGGSVLVLLFILLYAKQTSRQTAEYKAASKLLQKIQTSARILALKEKQPFVIVRDVPRSIAIQPIISPYEVFVLDGITALPRAPRVSGGALKNALRNGELREITARWDATAEALMPVMLQPEKNSPAFSLNESTIASRLSPPLNYWKSVTLDPQAKALKISSNSIYEPGIRLWPGDLSPLDGDFMELVAEIETPVEPRNPNIELHWLTSQFGQYEKEDRRALTRCRLAEKGFQKYLLSLRSTGWTTNGTINSLTLGFPSSSKVKLRRMAVIPGDGLYPTISLSATKPQRASDHFESYCINYPDDPRLGLFALFGSDKLQIDYDASSIEGASGAVLEIMPADDLGPVDQQDYKIDQRAKSLKLATAKGAVTLKRDQFPTAGLYRVRLIATGQDGSIKGKFSDSIECMISKAGSE